MKYLMWEPSNLGTLKWLWLLTMVPTCAVLASQWVRGVLGGHATSRAQLLKGAARQGGVAACVTLLGTVLLFIAMALTHGATLVDVVEAMPTAFAVDAPFALMTGGVAAVMVLVGAVCATAPTLTAGPRGQRGGEDR